MIASIIVFGLSVAGLVVIIALNRLPEPSLVEDRSFEPQLADDRRLRSVVEDLPTESETQIPDPWSSVGDVPKARSVEYWVPNAHVRDLRMRIKQYAQDSDALVMQISSVVRNEDAVPDSSRGWPLSVVGACIGIGIALELPPALMTAQALMSLPESAARLYTAIVVVATAIAIASPLYLGELLRLKREPRRHSVLSRVQLIAVLLLNVLLLCAGHVVRATHAGASPAFDNGLAGIEAVSLTFVAGVGMAFIVAAGAYRESFGVFRLRNTIAQLRRDLTWSETYLRAAQRDLERAAGAIAEAREAPTAQGSALRADAPSHQEDDLRK